MQFQRATAVSIGDFRMAYNSYYLPVCQPMLGTYIRMAYGRRKMLYQLLICSQCTQYSFSHVQRLQASSMVQKGCYSKWCVPVTQANA